MRNEELVLKTDAITLEPQHKRVVAATIRKVMRKRRDERLQSLPSQGKAMRLVSKSKVSSHFIRSGTFTRFVDWRFIHRARLNLLSLNGTPWAENKGCRRCNEGFESLGHVLNVCVTHKANMTKRHDDIVRRIKMQASRPRTRCRILYENQQIPGAPNKERPDLIIQKDRTAYVIDVTIPFESGEDAFKKARARKKEKYEWTRQALRGGDIRSVVVDAFIVGSLGSWDPDNEAIVELFTSKFDRTLFKNLCVSNAIKWSRDIYTEHIAGKGIIGQPLPSQLPF